MKKYARIAYIFIILLILLSIFLVYKVSGKDESQDKIQEKLLSSIKYFDNKFTDLFNEINNIKFENYTISVTEPKEEENTTETNKEARIFQCSSWILQHVIFKDQSLYKPNEPYGVMMALLKQYSVSGKKQLDDVPDVFSNFALRVTQGNRVARVEAAVNPFRRY